MQIFLSEQHFCIDKTNLITALGRVVVICFAVLSVLALAAGNLYTIHIGILFGYVAVAEFSASASVVVDASLTRVG